MLSRKADYGVRAMLDIAKRPPATRAIVAEIAERQNIPAFYLAKIMPRLARAGLVRTSLGAGGGIALAAPPEEISLLQIIQAIDGPFALNLCSVNPASCEHHGTCPACETWCQAQTELNQTLAAMRLSDLAARGRQSKRLAR
ncbi:MAG: Rrf2 family transcriptional regulator [Chloroflexota bacterium]|nr:Rrf2 family transcriptional regulator [Chloroflexota bacterium]